MYRVMIVDDEEPVLDSFSFILKKGSEDFTLCGKARSGNEAIRVMAETKPDVVFMDIQMPGINGLEAIDQVRHQYPHTVFILATAYERFDIARKAIPLGVFSYLVKPVSKRKFLDELDKVKLHLDSSRNKRQSLLEDKQFLSDSKNEKKNNFLTSLQWKNPSETEWSAFCRLYDLSCSGGAVYLAGYQDHSRKNISEADFNSLYERIQFKYTVYAARTGCRILFLFPDNTDLGSLEDSFSSMADAILPKDVDRGSGKLKPFSGLCESYREALRPFTGRDEEIRESLTEFGRLKNFCTELITADRERGKELFHQYQTEQFNRRDFNMATAVMISLFTLIQNELSQLTIPGHSAGFSPAEELSQLKSREAWNTWASSAMDRLYSHLEFRIVQTFPAPLSRALNYIENHYREPLQLSGIAEECQVTASYLSRLFSEHTRSKFSEYLNRYRLNKAMICLFEKHMSVKETSYEVGYQDPNYFSRIFRKYMGYAPTEREKGEQL